MCESNIFVGLEIIRDTERKIMFLHQAEYTKKVLKRFYMDNAKHISTPMEKGLDLRLVQQHDTDSEKLPYRQLIGSLMFLSNVSRPDIAFSVNYLSRYVDGFSRVHWESAKRILRYLSSTIYYGLLYERSESPLELNGYCDSDFAGDQNTRRSTSGFTFKIGNNTVSWGVQGQRSVALSTTEAEFVAATVATREDVYLRQLLSDLGYPSETASILKVDNQSAIQLIKNPVFHQRTKHMDIRYHFIREKYTEGTIDVQYVPSEIQFADIFTKALPREKHELMREGIELRDSNMRTCAKSL